MKPKSEIPAGWPVYAVRRFFQDGRPSRRIKSTLTLAQAQAHCSDPETSSTTAKPARAARYGCPWFDGYEVMHESMKRLRRDGYDV